MTHVNGRMKTRSFGHMLAAAGLVSFAIAMTPTAAFAVFQAGTIKKAKDGSTYCLLKDGSTIIETPFHSYRTADGRVMCEAGRIGAAVKHKGLQIKEHQSK